jgi:hypothetical protein
MHLSRRWSFQNREGETFAIRSYIQIPHDTFLKGEVPLFKRGWAFQVRLLSPRTLHFADHVSPGHFTCHVVYPLTNQSTTHVYTPHLRQQNIERHTTIYIIYTTTPHQLTDQELVFECAERDACECSAARGLILRNKKRPEVWKAFSIDEADNEWRKTIVQYTNTSITFESDIFSHVCDMEGE